MFINNNVDIEDLLAINAVKYIGYAMRKIKIIEVKSELGAGTRGASLGVEAIKIAALDFGNTYFKTYQSIEVPHENQLLLAPYNNPFAKRIPGVLTMVTRVADQVDQVLKNKEFPIILSGDHSTAAGSISGIKKAFPRSTLGVVWIDAHADIHSPYTTPSGNLHGMPLAAVLNEDNMDCRINKPDQETIDDWYQLKNTSNISPKLTYKDLVYVAVRDTEPPEDYLIKKHQIKNFSTADIRKLGMKQVAVGILQLLNHCDLIYVSFDVDSMDASISKGTGTPVYNGITKLEAEELILNLMTSDKVCCFEMVEINPTLDKENIMAENAFEILVSATNSLTNN